VPAKQVCSPVGDRCDQIMNEEIQLCNISFYVKVHVDLYSSLRVTRF